MDGSGMPGADGGGDTADGGVSVFALSLSTDEVTVSRGATADLDVTVTREYDFSQPVVVVVRNLPKNVTMVALSIYADQTFGTVTISADDAAVEGTYQDVDVRGRVGLPAGDTDRIVPLLLNVAAP